MAVAPAASASSCSDATGQPDLVAITPLELWTKYRMLHPDRGLALRAWLAVLALAMVTQCILIILMWLGGTVPRWLSGCVVRGSTTVSGNTTDVTQQCDSGSLLRVYIGTLRYIFTAIFACELVRMLCTAHRVSDGKMVASGRRQAGWRRICCQCVRGAGCHGACAYTGYRNPVEANRRQALKMYFCGGRGVCRCPALVDVVQCGIIDYVTDAIVGVQSNISIVALLLRFFKFGGAVQIFFVVCRPPAEDARFYLRRASRRGGRSEAAEV